MKIHLKNHIDTKFKQMLFEEERYGYQIIINVIFRFLQKLGYISYIEEPEEPVFAVIETKQITAMEEFRSQCLNFLRNNQEPKSVIVGRNCFHELRENFFMNCYTIPVYDDDLRFGVNGDRFKMQELDGIIVPNFEGILVLPYEIKN